MGEVILRESTKTAFKESKTKKGVFYIKIISADVEGSSGYYPATVLERDGARAFPAGTHMYLDHSSVSEEYERPERSVKDLAAYFLEDPKFLENGPEGAGLYTHVQVLPHHLEFVESVMDVAGVSIAATGLQEYNPEAGRDEVTALLFGKSVDIVTRAGAGGRILEMTESARAAGKEAVPQVFELKETDKAGMQKLYEALTQSNEAVQALTAKVTELEEKAATAEKKREEEATLSIGDIVSKLDAAELPAVSRKYLADSYTQGMDLDAAIKDEQSRVEAIKAEIGGGTNTNGENADGKTQEQRESVGQVKESEDSYTTATNLITGLFG